MFNGQRLFARHARSLQSDSFRVISDEAAGEPTSVALLSEENLIGVYENVSGAEVVQIGISDSALIVSRQGRCARVLYKDIQSVMGPPEKVASPVLTIQCIGGTKTGLPVLGGRGRSRDVWKFQRFLERVRADHASSSRGFSSERPPP